MSEATLDTSALNDLDGLDPEPDVSTDPETPEPSADEPAAVAAEPEPAADDGPARDQHGRFGPKGAETAPPVADAPIETAQAAPEWKPFAIKVKGQETP